MISIEAIFAIGGLAMIGVGLLGGLEFEKLKIQQLPNWIRAITIITGIVLLALSVSISPDSPFIHRTDFRSTEEAFYSTQTAQANIPTPLPILQTVIVNPPTIESAQETSQTLATGTIVPNSDFVPIESLGVYIFDSSGRESGKGKSSSTLTAFSYRDIPYLFYDLLYETADDDSSVSLSIQFRDKIDLTQYSAIQFTIRFLNDKTRCNLGIYGSSDSKFILLGEGVIDDENIKDNVSIYASRGREHTITIPIKPVFEQIGLSEVSYIHFYTNKTITGEARKDQFTVSDLKLIK